MNQPSGSGGERLLQRVTAHLAHLYGGDQAVDLAPRVITAMRYPAEVAEPPAYRNHWDQSDCWVISYATSIRDGDGPGLPTLLEFLDRHLGDAVSGVHVLPFYPWSSDDGFAVTDYMAVHPEAGTWDDVQALAGRYRLMADLVINHASAQSTWFQNYLARRDPGRDWFKEADPEADLSQVVRPRSTPLRQRVETTDGERWVWCTFGPDQVDLDFGNPEVLLAMVEVLRHYLEQGVKVIRLDAVAFLWKEPGTPCLHDQRTHEVIKLLRTLVDFLDPSVMLITETNVPNRDNLTYFGNANEAHAIYNFSLPPLLIHALLTGNGRHLKTWLMSMPPSRDGTTYLNFIASHDGIGMRPTDGLLTPEEQVLLIDTLTRFGGRVSMRTGADGDQHPYEVNISLVDALAGTTADGIDGFQLPRFLCAHAIMLALEGIPALYIHSLLGTPNDLEGMAATGRNRSINRRSWDLQALEAELARPGSLQARICSDLQRLLRLRRGQPAFHPNAIQFTLHLGLELFGVWRKSLDRTQDMFCISNLTNRPQPLELENINLISTENWRDLIAERQLDPAETTLYLAPYQTLWLTNT